MRKVFVALYALTFLTVAGVAGPFSRMDGEKHEMILKLQAAIDDNDLTDVCLSLKSGASTDIYDVWMTYFHPLREAVEKSFYYGQRDPITQEWEHETAYKEALGIMQVLLDYGANMNELDKENMSALLKAVEMAEQKIHRDGYDARSIETRKLKLLLDYGQKKQVLGKAQRGVLTPAIRIAGESLDLAELLLNYDIPVRRSDIKYAKQLQEEAMGKKSAYNYNRLVPLLEAKRSQENEEAKKLLKEEFKRSWESTVSDPNMWKY